MDRNDDDRVNGRLHGDQPEAARDGMALRLLYMVIIAVMLSVAQTVLTLITVVQFVIMLVNTGQRNPRLADFGTDLGIWMAKAARYQSAASEVKPWPWTDLD
jgi:succinate-acetate transporter protein